MDEYQQNKFCFSCGAKLISSHVKSGRYSSTTGRVLHYVIPACPNDRWWKIFHQIKEHGEYHAIQY